MIAKTKLALVTFAAGAIVPMAAASCSSGSTSADAGTTSSSSGSSSGGFGSSSGTSGSGGSSGGVSEASTCMSVPLTPSMTGYVDTTSIGIVGAWFAYGDNVTMTGQQGPNEMGNCSAPDAGAHMASQCSVITFPPLPDDGGTASFPQTTAGTMCLSGTAAKVVGEVSSPTSPDYSNIFGIGIGLDFNNPMGTPLPYNATMNNVTGFSFTIAGLPTTGTVRVEFPEAATNATGDAWSYTPTTNGPITINLKSGMCQGCLSPSFTPPTGVTQPAWDPTMVQAVQFHVVTSTSGPVDVSNFCISNLSAIVCP